MPDKFSPEVRSRIMSKIRSKNTFIEKIVFKELRREGMHFQKHYRKALGTPDVAIPEKKIAVFIDGDFWHGYLYPQWKKRIKSRFWRKKIERNRRRDQLYFRALRRRGWNVIRVWEHQLKDDPVRTLGAVVRYIRNNTKELLTKTADVAASAVS